LIDKNYTTFSENYVQQKLSFELGQLWMHPYINYKTREHYWLHDSLAHYFQAVALLNFNKRQQVENLILEERLYAMREELNYKSTSLMFFHQNHLDDEDYHNFVRRKGISILRMVNNTLGEKALQVAIQKYLSKMKNLEYADFIEGFNVTKTNSFLKMVNVSDFIYKWVASEKYPVVTVRRNKENGSILLNQVRSINYSEYFLKHNLS
jgi:aminopeptidase N